MPVRIPLCAEPSSPLLLRLKCEIESPRVDMLDRLLSGSKDYARLPPDAWAKSAKPHPESVRHYRAEERRQRNAGRDRARLDRRLS